MKLTTGDRIFADPDGNGLIVVEVLAVTKGTAIAAWDGTKVYHRLDAGENPHVIRPENHERYPLGQRAGEGS